MINVIDHLLFNRQKYILETDAVKQKLANYDRLKAFHDTAIKSKVYSPSSGYFQYVAWCDENGNLRMKNAEN